MRGDFANPPGGFYTIQLRQADIHQNQIRLQVTGEMDGFQTIVDLTDDQKLGSLFQLCTKHLPERFEILNDEYPQKWHRTSHTLSSHKLANWPRIESPLLHWCKNEHT